MDLVNMVEREQMKKELADFGPGDTVRIHIKVIEGSRERLQAFEGVCIERKNKGLRETFTLRRVAHGVGVERSFLIHSPNVEKMEIIRRGQVSRAKLYYLRSKIGKAARIREVRVNTSVSAAASKPSETGASPTPAKKSRKKA
ncbi:MAG: 50S ribosomal protein L19 [Armatimonadetes bacterium]|nr:50S ribosomal protein L19 [Armatimonadota bacterium]